MKLHMQPLNLLTAGTEQVQNEKLRELVKAASAQWNTTHRFNTRGSTTETHWGNSETHPSSVMQAAVCAIKQGKVL